jgi:hypothetical protein
MQRKEKGNAKEKGGASGPVGLLGRLSGLGLWKEKEIRMYFQIDFQVQKN